MDGLASVPAHVPAERVFDFDLFHDPRIVDDAHRGMVSLHQDAPDIFWTPRNGGHWMVTRDADVRAVMTAAEIFANSAADIRPTPPAERIALPPQDMDPPEHMRHRMILMRFLGPTEVLRLKPALEAIIHETIDQLENRNACEFKAEVGVPVPVKLFMTLMGMDLARFRECVHWVDEILGSDDRARILPAFMALTGYLTELIQARIAAPGDDPISLLLRAEIGGELLSPRRVHEMANLLFLAGLHTVTSALTYIMHYLAQHADVQQRLRDAPGMIDTAVEEFMRRFTFVNIPRRVAVSTAFRGVQMQAGDRVICSLTGGSNDARSVERPEEVDFDRKRIQHLGFNTGPHLCAGASLARMEMRSFLEIWLKRMPDVRLAEGFVARNHGGSVMGMARLDLVW